MYTPARPGRRASRDRHIAGAATGGKCEMGSFSEWSSDASASDQARAAARDYYDRCDQSVHISVTMPISIVVGRGFIRGVAWLARWVTSSALLGGLYLALGMHGPYVLPCAIVGGVALGNLARYLQWRFFDKEEEAK